MPIRKRISNAPPRIPTPQEIADMPFTVGVNAKFRHYGIGKTEADDFEATFDAWYEGSSAIFKNPNVQAKVDEIRNSMDALFATMLRSFQFYEYEAREYDDDGRTNT